MKIKRSVCGVLLVVCFYCVYGEELFREVHEISRHKDPMPYPLSPVHKILIYYI
jgi:hypothetical protein